MSVNSKTSSTVGRLRKALLIASEKLSPLKLASSSTETTGKGGGAGGCCKFLFELYTPTLQKKPYFDRWWWWWCWRWCWWSNMIDLQIIQKSLYQYLNVGFFNLPLPHQQQTCQLGAPLHGSSQKEYPRQSAGTIKKMQNKVKVDLAMCHLSQFHNVKLTIPRRVRAAANLEWVLRACFNSLSNKVIK